MTREPLAQLPEIHSMGVAAYDPVWASRTHATRDRMELLYVRRGRLTLVLPRRRLEAGPGDVLVVPSDTPHRDEFDLGLGLEVFLVHFRWAGERTFLRAAGLGLPPDTPPETRAQIAHILDSMLADWRGEADEDRLLARSRLHLALLLMLRAVRSGRARKDQPPPAFRERKARLLMTRARNYLERHYAGPVALDDIAHALQVSSYYLSRIFTRESGFSLFAYLTSLRLEKAMTLLADGRLNVAEVARAVGYEDANYFSTVFRHHVGRTPREYACSPGRRVVASIAPSHSKKRNSTRQ